MSETEVLELAKREEDPESAIRLLEPRPLGFELDSACLERLEGQGLDRDVLDYLKKRAKLDWASLRGDVNPEGPE